MTSRLFPSPRTLATSPFWFAFLLAQLLGCARVYRPITVTPATLTAPSGEVRAAIGFQPWGDNSRYLERAREEGVQMLILTVANGTGHAVQVSLDPGPIPGEWLSPLKAHAMIKQGRFGYALYPIGSLALLPPGQTGAWSGMANAASGISFGVTLTIALSNAAVATSSNRKLEAFFTQNAWVDGEIPIAGTRQGLFWFRPHAPRAPGLLRLQVVDGSGSRTIDIPLPEQPVP